MSSYTSSPSTPAPQAASNPVEVAPTNTVQLQNPDMTSVYPSVAPAQAPVPANNHNTPQQQVLPTQRVSTLVPALKVYALLTIVYTLYTVASYSSLFRTTRTASGMVIRQSSIASPMFFMVFGVSFISLAIGCYLLMSKSFGTVSALLTALLIINGLGLLQSLSTAVQYPSIISFRYIVSLLISGGLLMYLWSVKSQVELAGMKNS